MKYILCFFLLVMNHLLIFSKEKLKANAGNNIMVDNQLTTASLNATLPDGAKGVWQIVAGEGGYIADPNDPKTLFSGRACSSYSLRWKVYQNTDSAQADITVSFYHKPSKANAGDDIVVNNSNLKVNLNAQWPSSGTGRWSIVSGNDGSLADTLNNNVRFIGQPCTSYVLRWTVSTQCAVSEDEINVIFRETSSKANAGKEKLSVDCSGVIQLQALQPQNGNGHWSVISGSDGSFENENQAVTNFVGQTGNSYVLRWTVKTSCDSTYDDFSISIPLGQPQADAGGNVAVDSGIYKVNLKASTGDKCSGSWLIINGAGGSFNNDKIANPIFQGQPGETYTLRYLLNCPCKTSSDDITVEFK